ncbi:unnamed protein product [Caenorhabditis bovis]|uniref:Uncharacterized protein n=1 Tax=Caenorhabditis bovis TaxID=2654633 RepID=A0A8S1F0A9_9PELO|nr:unnamed protein product [Caenorhabditis bovis]
MPRLGLTEGSSSLTFSHRDVYADRNQFYLDNDGKVKFEPVWSEKPKGSAKRKMGYGAEWYAKYQLVLADSEPEKKANKNECFNVEEEEKLTLADLFPSAAQRNRETAPVDVLEKPKIKVLKRKARKSFESGVCAPETLPKRSRRSLPYGVFEEDSTDNEDDYGFERIPETLRRPTTTAPPPRAIKRANSIESTSSSSQESDGKPDDDYSMRLAKFARYGLYPIKASVYLALIENRRKL